MGQLLGPANRRGTIRQHDTSTRSAPEYARRGGRTGAGKALRALAAPPRRHPAPLHPLQGSCASSRAARRRQHGLPGASSSMKNPLRYLSDRTGDHARVKRQRDAEARMAAPARTSKSTSAEPYTTGSPPRTQSRRQAHHAAQQRAKQRRARWGQGASAEKNEDAKATTGTAPDLNPSHRW